MIKLPIVLVAGVLLVTPALAQVGNEHPVKCTPATCAGTSGDVGPYLPIIQPPGISMPVSPSSPCCTFSQSITIPRSLNGTSGIIGTTSAAIIVDDGSIPRGDKRNAADLKRAYNYCEKYLHVQFCDMVCTSIPNHYADPNCNVIQSLWLSSDWKKQDDARDKKAEQDEIEHAKAFVAAVMRQNP